MTAVPVTLTKLHEAESIHSLKLMSLKNMLEWERGGGTVVILVLQQIIQQAFSSWPFSTCILSLKEKYPELCNTFDISFLYYTYQNIQLLIPLKYHEKGIFMTQRSPSNMLSVPYKKTCYFLMEV